jgi:hypothetical protein
MNEPRLTYPPLRPRRSPLGRAFAALTLAAAGLQIAGCAGVPAVSGDGASPVSSASPPPALGASAAAPPAHASLETTYGIKVEALRLTAAGSMLDLRYRVLDPEKAASVLDGKTQPYLLDAARSAKLGVPDTPVLGRIRQTARNNKIRTDHSYFVMFGNPGKAVQSGDTVTLVLGKAKVTDLMVQ